METDKVTIIAGDPIPVENGVFQRVAIVRKDTPEWIKKNVQDDAEALNILRATAAATGGDTMRKLKRPQALFSRVDSQNVSNSRVK